MVEVRHGGIRVTWEPVRRVMQFHYDDDSLLTAEAADALIPQVAPWVEDGKPYGVLVDARGTTAAGEPWRKRWAAFHKQHHERLRIAIYRVSPFIRGFLLIYSQWTSVPLRCFGNESEAREWLDEHVGVTPQAA